MVLVVWGIYDRVHPARELPPATGRVFREQVPTEAVNPGDSGTVRRWLLRIRDTMILRRIVGATVLRNNRCPFWCWLV